jgi:hypothetical protein
LDRSPEFERLPLEEVVSTADADTPIGYGMTSLRTLDARERAR